MFAKFHGSLVARAFRQPVFCHLPSAICHWFAAFSSFCLHLFALRFRLPRLALCTLHFALCISLLSGCKKSEPPAESKPSATNAASVSNSALPTPNSTPPLARLHWIGKKKLAADTNSAYLMTIWNLPESAKLEAQTLNKLAIAPWLAAAKSDSAAVSTDREPSSARSNARNPTIAKQTEPPTSLVAPKSDAGGLATSSNRPPTNGNSGAASPPVITNYDEVIAAHPTASLLRPLLDDLLQEEWHLEVKSAESGAQSPGSAGVSPASTPKSEISNLKSEIVLAIRLDDKQDALWRANLPKVYKSLPTAPKSNAGGLSTLPSQLSFSRSAPWTLVTIAPGLTPPANELRRLGTQSSSSSSSSSSSPLGPGWLDGTLDLPKLAAALGGHLSSDWPQVTMTVTGDGQNLRTRAELEFSSPLPLELEPWNIPTNLIHDPLIGFMAIRGIRPWLEKWKGLTDLHLGKLPNQAFFWAQKGPPSYHFMAAPSTEASNQVRLLSGFALDKLNPMLESNKLGTFQATADTGLHWRGIPWFSPKLEYADFGQNSYLVAALAKSSVSNGPWPDALRAQLTDTNMLLYDWELSGACADGLSQMGQMSRNVFGLARMTRTAGFNWLIAATSKLGNSASAIKVAGPSTLRFSRISTLGLTGAELQLLADWLESPRFPMGLHTILAPGSVPVKPLPSYDGAAAPNTNAVTPKPPP